jgi:hypothetical protein
MFDPSDYSVPPSRAFWSRMAPWSMTVRQGRETRAARCRTGQASQLEALTTDLLSFYYVF